MIKNFYYKNKQIALVIKNSYSNEGIKFFTQDDSAQQIAYMSHPKNAVIKAHIHNKVQRKVSHTQETLIIKKGKLRLDLYSQEKEYIESTILETGDIVFLAYGGHGLKCLEDVSMIEVKQGPYLGVNDKERFAEISDEKVIINE
ncbi:MAG: hypothetical protein E7Z90_03480 [Cyanobacteria bacterium SIG29]|nr:hypothetical protein [Cyanobacteria bacterium SIG29]